jgi:hypothetical protein
VLAYQNVPVVERYAETEKVSLADGLLAFEALKQFLYTCSVVDQPVAPSKRIDDIWHVFILFTKDYREFCKDILGSFVDHVPSRLLIPLNILLLKKKPENYLVV